MKRKAGLEYDISSKKDMKRFVQERKSLLKIVKSAFGIKNYTFEDKGFVEVRLRNFLLFKGSKVAQIFMGNREVVVYGFISSKIRFNLKEDYKKHFGEYLNFVQPFTPNT